jgi:PucR C-terminal helix-turn-helix domain/GGDEF-like domain
VDAEADRPADGALGPVPDPAAPRRPGLPDQTIRRIEQATGRLATQSVARMDDELPWFRELPSDQRSWVTLVAQAGLQSYVEWLRSPDDVLRLTGEVFATAPQAMARSVTLQQTVELVRTAIGVAEENLPGLAGAEDEAVLREELLRFSREVAFAAARVYASAAENRGSWDRRLEALVIDNLISGSLVGDPLPSQLAALGWHDIGPVAAVVGSAPDGPPDTALTDVHTRTNRLGLDAMAGVHGERLVVVVGGVSDPLAAAADLLPVFGDGPVVVGPVAKDIAAATSVTQAALSGLRVVPAWPGAPRPVSADALLPERALAGDPEARTQLVESVYRPLVAAGDVLVDTVAAFLDAGGALEATARALFVHANTVRYRLRRVAEVCGEAPTDPRGALTLRLALVLGRLETLS